MEQKEIEALIDLKIEEAINKQNEKIDSAIEDIKDLVAKKGAGKGLSAADVEEIIDERFSELKSEINGGAKAPKFKADPDFEPEYENDETIILLPTKENTIHAAGKEFEAKGELATHLIKKGAATFVKVKPKASEKKNNKKDDK